MNSPTTHHTKRYYVDTGWRESRPFAVIDGRGARIVSDWPTEADALADARDRNGCRICGQRSPHLETCPAFGTEGLAMYYGEPDPDEAE